MGSPDCCEYLPGPFAIAGLANLAAPAGADDESLILAMTSESLPTRKPSSTRSRFSVAWTRRLSCLSPRQRAVFILRHYEALSLEEIAGILHLDVGTVKAHLFRALGKLREELKDIYTARSGGTLARQT